MVNISAGNNPCTLIVLFDKSTHFKPHLKPILSKKHNKKMLCMQLVTVLHLTY